MDALREDDPTSLGRNPADGAPVMTLREKLRNWRNRRIADPRFRRLVERFWLTRRFANRQANELFRITAGFVYSQTLHACVELGIFNALEDGPLATARIHRMAAIRRPGIPIAGLRRLLEAARDLGLLIEINDGVWTLDDFGAVIAGDPGIRAMVTHHAMLYRDLADPVALIAGEKRETEIGRYWAYAKSSDPGSLPHEQISAYSTLMEESQAMVAQAVIDSHPFGRHRHVLDIGGGDGAFLSQLHQRHPEIELSLFDLPSVAQMARPFFASRHPGSRLNIQGGDFFRDRFEADADLLTLIRICCDHDDDAVLVLLSNIHRSMKPGARLLIGEAMGTSGAGERLASAYFKLYFTAMGSGECRTPARLQALLARAGFSSSRYRRTANPLIASVVLAEK